MQRGIRKNLLWSILPALLLALALVPVLTGREDKKTVTKPSATKLSSSGYRLIGWNDLGMHCVDGNDYSVFSILPPYNNLHVQLVSRDGKLVKSPSALSVTYQAVADPDGSINRTSIGKTNFWDFVLPLFGVQLAPDVGLAGNRMPGASNTPRALTWDSASLQ